MVKYDIVFVDFPHRQHDGTSSRHPALVLDGNRIAKLAAQITGNLNLVSNTDYVIKNWQESGLHKPSKIRLGQQEAFTEDSVIFQIGHLDEEDIKGVEKILYEEDINEDTIKQGNKWVNKGDTGETHGEFKTKKEADAQRKAMFASGWKNK